MASVPNAATVRAFPSHQDTPAADDGLLPSQLRQLLSAIFEPDDTVLLRPIETWAEGGRKLSRLLYKLIRHFRVRDLLCWPGWQEYAGAVESDRGNFFFGVRQSRIGVKPHVPTPLGEITAQFDIDMFGVGADAGQTTIRLRHAYAQLGQFGFGQTESPFMDLDVFPNVVDYWGPNGMVFFRNVQARWMPIKGEYDKLTIAVERPGASADQGIYGDRIELDGVKGRFPLPDLSGEYRKGGTWGYVEVAGMLRKMNWDDIDDDQFDLTGSATGWGINLTSNLKPTSQDVVRLQLVVGEGIQNYMNDAPVDVGIQNNFSNPRTPIVGKALPIVGIVAFLDHTWNSQWSTAVGYSMTDIDNTDAQSPDAYRRGHYALGNVLYSPVPNVMVGGELQWGRRENYSDGFHSDGVKIQFSFKYNFSAKIGG